MARPDTGPDASGSAPNVIPMPKLVKRPPPQVPAQDIPDRSETEELRALAKQTLRLAPAFVR
jgi:hypothetical protein